MDKGKYSYTECLYHFPGWEESWVELLKGVNSNNKCFHAFDICIQLQCKARTINTWELQDLFHVTVTDHDRPVYM